MYGYVKLKERIKDRYGSMLEFSKAVGSKDELVAKKLACESGLSRRDIECWAENLEIPPDELLEYFFK